jgi:hypothetical protein
MITRRTFLIAGVVGATGLIAAAWLRNRGSNGTGTSRAALGADGEAILAAVAPVVLDGALPPPGADRQSALDETLDGIDRAVAGLPPRARDELAQLFALLALPPTRLALSRLTTPWSEAPPERVRAFVERLRDSRFALLRSAYDALHQLIYASWYANPRAWPAIGYDGPPRIL